jgi:hypothetical protein
MIPLTRAPLGPRITLSGAAAASEFAYGKKTLRIPLVASVTQTGWDPVEVGALASGRRAGQPRRLSATLGPVPELGGRESEPGPP